MTAETLIMEALFEHLSTLVLDPVHKIAWPNKAFTPPPDHRYLRVQFVPNLANRVLISSDGPHQHLGLLQVSVYDTKGKGESRAREIAGLIAEHFATDLRLFNDPISVRVTKHPDVSDVIVEKEAIQIPVMVAWECWAKPIDRSYPFVNQEASDLAAQMFPEPSNERKAIIDRAFTSLKAGATSGSNLLNKLDALYMLGAHSAQAARLNWAQRAYDLTEIASAPFTTDKGYQGNGSSQKLASTFNPITSPSPKLRVDSGHMGMFSLTNLDNAGADTAELGSFGANAWIGRRGGIAGQARGRAANTSTLNMASTSMPGHAIWTKTDATTWEAYGAGQDRGGTASIVSSLLSGTFDVLAAGSLWGVNQVFAAHWGSELTPAEVVDLSAVIARYLFDIQTTFANDNFDRAGPALGSTPQGKPWVQVPAGDTTATVAAIIESGGVTTNDAGLVSNTATYSGLDCGSPCIGLEAEIEFLVAGAGSRVTLISQPNGLGHVSDVTNNSIHINFGPSTVTVGFWEAGVLSNIATYSYPSGAIPLNTPKRVGWLILGSSIFILCPDGTVQGFTDSRVGLAGRYAMIENFWPNAEASKNRINSARFVV